MCAPCREASSAIDFTPLTLVLVTDGSWMDLSISLEYKRYAAHLTVDQHLDSSVSYVHAGALI